MHFSQNRVFVEGLLEEVELIDGNDKNNKPYVRGHVVVGVDQNVNGKNEHEAVRLSFYASKYTKAGAESQAYKNIKALENFKRVSTDGDAADGIRANTAALEEFARKDASDTVVSSWSIRNTFFTKVPAIQLNPKAVFENEIYIREMSDEVDTNGEPTGRLTLVGILVNGYGDIYNGHIIRYVVENPAHVDYITKNWHEGDTVLVKGYIRNGVQTRSVTPMDIAGFGATANIGGERPVRELVIVGGSDGPADDDVAFQEDEMRQLMNERKNRIEADANKRAAASAGNAASGARRVARGGW